MRNGINVAAYDARPEFQRLPKSGPASHEGVKDNSVVETCLPVESLSSVCAFGSQRTDHNRSKRTAEAMCPPLVDVVQRPVDLFSPAFDLAKIAEVLKRKPVIL